MVHSTKRAAIAALCVGLSGWALTCAALSQEPAISEVLVNPVGINTGHQTVELLNPSDGVLEIGALGYWLRLPPVAWRFPSTAVIPPGGVITVHVNAVGVDSATDLFTGTSGMRSLTASDSLALFAANDFQNPLEIVDFVEWGAAGLGGEDVAAAAGIWTAATTVDVSTLRPGATLSYDGDGDGADNWCVDGTPTPGAPNDVCTTSYARAAVFINEIGREGPWAATRPFIELKNEANVLEDLSGQVIAIAGEPVFEFPAGVFVGAGEIVLVHLLRDGQDSDLEYFAGETVGRDFLPSDSVSLHANASIDDATWILDFVQWGSAGGAFEAQAVEAGLWEAGAFVDTTHLHALGALAAVSDPVAGRSWGVDNTPTPGQENSAGPSAPAIVINELLVDPPGIFPGGQFVELANLDASGAVDVGGMTLCTESVAAPGTPQCYSIPEATLIPPASFLVVRVNQTGTDGEMGDTGVPEVFTGPFQELPIPGGELALFQVPAVSDSNNLVDFVRWGTGEPFFEEVAADVGIWSMGDAVDTSAMRDGASIAYLGAGDTGDSYRIDVSPSPGVENEEPPVRLPFHRGDCNDDGEADLSDAVMTLQYLFTGGEAPLCDDACDTNDDSTVDVSDAVYLLDHLYRGGPAIPYPEPGPTCGADLDEPVLTCDAYLHC